jgi:hypothetical protein
VTEKKVCAWLQDNVLQRKLGPRKARGTRLPTDRKRPRKGPRKGPDRVAKRGPEKGTSKPSTKGKEPAALAESNDDDDLELDLEMEPDTGSDSSSDSVAVVASRCRRLGTVKTYIAANVSDKRVDHTSELIT